jgi:hypothetical protein
MTSDVYFSSASLIKFFFTQAKATTEVAPIVCNDIIDAHNRTKEKHKHQFMVHYDVSE